jgi:hypothetical protein
MMLSDYEKWYFLVAMSTDFRTSGYAMVFGSKAGIQRAILLMMLEEQGTVYDAE